MKRIHPDGRTDLPEQEGGYIGKPYALPSILPDVPHTDAAARPYERLVGGEHYWEVSVSGREAPLLDLSEDAVPYHAHTGLERLLRDTSYATKFGQGPTFIRSTEEFQNHRPHSHILNPASGLAKVLLAKKYDERELRPEELALLEEFEAHVNSLDLSDLLHLQPGRKPPKNLSEYSLAPITSKTDILSDRLPGGKIKIPDGVACQYGSEGGLPVLDTSSAIGLVYRDTLVAVAGAYITDDGNLEIAQLQCVTKDASDPKKKYRTGLHGGFYWRDTLVQAWMEIAAILEADTLSIQGAENNRWISRERRMHLVKGYDMVAKRMGFTYHHGTGNWHIQLRPEATSEATSIQENLPLSPSWRRRLLQGILS